MPPPEVERFEAAVGGLLEDLGYRRAFPLPSPEALECAARARAGFSQDALAQGYTIPAYWQGPTPQPVAAAAESMHREEGRP
jgi:hypothetical protein